MLTRFVRIQLGVFTALSVVGILVMVFVYMQVPTMLGLGRITVTLELPATGGLYRFSNVTYRGVQIGKVTAVDLTRTGAKATLSLDSSPRVPADLTAEVRSASAIGEQYVDLLPRTDSGPSLRDGSVIALHETKIPQPVAPVVNQLSQLLASIPRDKLGVLIDESFKGFNGAGYDLGSLIDSSSRFVGDLNGAADRTRQLIDDSVPLLDAQAQTADETRTWARSLAGITGQLVDDDAKIRTVLQTGPSSLDEVSGLLDQIKPTLPVLLANLTTLGQIAVTYNPALRQILVLLPPAVASTQYGLVKSSVEGMTLGDFAVSLADPPGCTTGYLPPSQWRSPADTTETDTPEGLYCKLPQDSPLAVRGTRNYPCAAQPGKRAPTVQLCESDKEYEPIAIRQHVLGPYPLDPNLIAQGIPPDDRITADEHLFAPTEGTPLPPESTSAPTDLGPSQAPAPPPTPDGAGTAAPPADQPGVAPSSFQPSSDTARPAVAVQEYDPHNGSYMAGGRIFQQADLVASKYPQSWKDLLPK
jgi:phospholipid/cholesterol/gamma-HCH transport system substrate-binding protein